MTRAIGVLLALASVAGLVLHAADVTARRALVQDFLADRTGATDAIVAAYGPDTATCAPGHQRDLVALGSALLTVETLATPTVEGWARSALVLIMRPAGEAPAISIGPGRIKLATARAILHNAVDAADIVPQDLPDAEIATRLLDGCTSLRVILASLTQLSLGPLGMRPNVDRRFVRAAAAAHNGQAAVAQSFNALLSDEIYLSLVYGVFQHYRFADLPTAAAEAEQIARR
jgi:hypothetical protein